MALRYSRHFLPPGILARPLDYQVCCRYCGLIFKNVRVELMRTTETTLDGDYIDIILGFDIRDVCEHIAYQWTQVSPLVVTLKNMATGDVLN